MLIIKELILVAFGKFHNKKIVLKDGINIIYGQDETGITTVHEFVEGMFFGFFKPYGKKKMYTDEYEEHMPRSGNDYYGILKYQYLDKTYRVERDFSKEKSELKVFNDKTGEELTNTYSDYLNLDRAVFNNAINTDQLDRLTNFEENLDVGLSVDNIMKNLRSEIEYIGMKRGVKSSLYEKEIENLEDEKSYKTLIKINEYTMDLKKLENKLKEMAEKRKRLKLGIELQEKYKRYKIYCEIKFIEQEIEELERNMATDLDRVQISTQEYNEILRINEKINFSKQQRQNIIRKEKNIEQELEIILKEIELLEKLKLNNDINFDIYKYESKEKELSKLKESKNQYNEKAQKEKILEINKKTKKFKNIRALITYLLFIISVLGLLNYNLFYVSIVLIFFLVITYRKEHKLKSRKIILEQLIEKILSSESDLKDEIKKVDQEICDIMNRHSSGSLKELKEQSVSLERQQKLNYEKNSFEKQRIDIDKEREKLTSHYQDMKLDLEYLLEKNNLKDINHLNENVNSREKDQDIMLVIESKKHIINDLRAENDIDKLKQEFKDYKFGLSDLNKLEKEDYNKLKQEFEIICKHISEEEFKIKEVKDKIELLQKNIGSVVTIPEEINRVKTKKEISPKLNKIISNLMSSINNRRYKEIEPAKKLSIKVIDNKGKLVDLSYLSCGVFAERIGNLPFILDDEFTQYDDDRLENILKFLYKESLKRQIIIFTCQEREIKTLDKLKLQYSLVKL